MMIRFTYPTVEKICFRIILNYLLVMVFLAITTVSFFIIGASVLRGQPGSYPRSPDSAMLYAHRSERAEVARTRKDSNACIYIRNNNASSDCTLLGIWSIKRPFICFR